ncbi:MAG TPA: hypothetical protein VH500_01620 [Nitrososphaeraceae archaeon]
MYIVNLFTPKESDNDTGINTVPLDPDGVNDRNLDIKLSDGYMQRCDRLWVRFESSS